ncbi:MAG: TonB-dependent receptor, partial [Vicinamibacterales bacterium]|nr:TonB-dependent receptor [Vicinamibacterales bacterium]
DDADEADEVLIDLASRRRVGRFDAGIRNLTNGVIDGFRVIFNVIDWEHDELETAGSARNLGTRFDNRAYVLRAEVNQRQTGTLAGKFGVWSKVRRYAATGEEALAPATDQTALAAFAYEELDFGRFRVQVGGRIERNAYTVDSRAEADQNDADGSSVGLGLVPSDVRDRAFTGASASAGMQVDLGRHVAFVANATRSYRAPALEELYNFGPHVGNLVFEIGNPDLEREATVGLDLSLRHQSTRFRSTLNAYVYDIDNFVFAGVGDAELDGLRVAPFLQGNSRFVGFEATASAELADALWVNIGIGMVDAELTDTNESLPRIPALRGQVSVDFPYRGFTLSPEWSFAAAQNRVFRDETQTDGHSVFNLKASYVWPLQHVAHILSVTGYNLTDELYRSHTSFIKNLAPEIGRGVKLAYSMRFY